MTHTATGIDECDRLYKSSVQCKQKHAFKLKAIGLVNHVDMQATPHTALCLPSLVQTPFASQRPLQDAKTSSLFPACPAWEGVKETRPQHTRQMHTL